MVGRVCQPSVMPVLSWVRVLLAAREQAAAVATETVQVFLVVCLTESARRGW